MASWRSGHVADLVQDQQVGSGQRLEQDGQTVLLASAAGAGDQIVQGQEIDAVAALDGLEGQAESQVRFADPGRSEEQDVGPLVQEAQRGELVDGLFGHLGLGVEIEAFQGPGRGHARQSQVGGHPALEAVGALAVEELIDHFHRQLLLFLALFQDRIQPCGRRSGRVFPGVPARRS